MPLVMRQRWMAVSIDASVIVTLLGVPTSSSSDGCSVSRWLTGCSTLLMTDNSGGRDD